MKNIIILAGLFIMASMVFGQEAVIRELTGTVEIKHQNSNMWETAVQGMSIAGGTIISTGFRSYALIGIGESELSVRPLTRLSLTELRSSTNMETINVTLQAGKVRANVTPPAGSRSSFTVQTPSATASVRGTVFEVDIFSLSVIEGSVEYSGSYGSAVVVDAGRNSFVNEKTGKAVFTKEMLLTSLSPAQPLAFDSYDNYFSLGNTHGKKNIEVVLELDFSK
jgi:hypothetical protein